MLRRKYCECLLIMVHIGIIVISLVPRTNAQDLNTSPYHISSEAHVIDLTPAAQFLADANDRVHPAEVPTELFASLKELEIQKSINTYWVRVSIRSDLPQASQWRLKLFQNWCEEVSVFSKRENEANNWSEQLSGYMHTNKSNSSSSAKLAYLPNSVHIELEPQATTVLYIRYTKVMRMDLQPDLILEPIIIAANQQIRNHKRSYYSMAIMGIFFILAIYHFLVYSQVRDETYLYYGLYGLTAVLATTVDDEHLLLLYDLFYESNTTLQPWIFMWSGPLVIIFYALFTRSFLNTTIKYPFLDRALKFLIVMLLIVLGIVSINFMATGRQYLPGMRFEIQFILVAGIYTLIIYNILKKRVKSEMYYAWGVGILLIILLPRYILPLLGFNDNWIVNWDIPVNNIQLGILAELLLFALGIGYRTREIQLEKQRIEEIDGLKSRFFEDVSHEFRTPLTLIMGPLQQLQKKLVSPADHNIVTLVLDQAKRLQSQVNQVLDLSKLEARQVTINAREQDIVAFAKGVFYSFESLAVEHGITLKSEVEIENTPLFFDHLKMESIITNLVSNAIKHTDNGGEITLTVRDYKQEIEISIADNGVGIRKNNLPHLFDRYYSAGDKKTGISAGYGIGLSLVKELVRLHHGKVSASSVLGQGSKFTLIFLKGRQHFKDEDIQKTNLLVTSQPLEKPLALPLSSKDSNSVEVNTNDGAPELLIIEDNADVRNFLKTLLSDNYKITEACDGTEGITRATEQTPDLIICDVAMPEKDGYEVCHELKNQVATSHIPIILLTAKADQEQRIEGLLTGADDYITKPFDSEELIIRVNNLIQQRTLLKQKWSGTEDSIKATLTHAPIDQEFLNSVLSFIKVKMSDENLDVEMIGKDIGLSSRQLNRKLKALIDKTGSQLISSIRLTEAARLLEFDKSTVTEITYTTGHRSSSYFSTVFKKEYGMTPTQYRTMKQQSN